MRNLSFALTTEQIRNRTKTVTRRKGTWWATVLKPGTLLCAVEKSQWIKKGGLVRLCVIRVVSVGRGPLEVPAWHMHRRWHTADEPAREGFPEMTWEQFVGMFCDHMRCQPRQIVTRIEFEYVAQAPVDDCRDCNSFGGRYRGLHRNGLCRCVCHGEEAFR